MRFNIQRLGPTFHNHTRHVAARQHVWGFDKDMYGYQVKSYINSPSWIHTHDSSIKQTFVGSPLIMVSCPSWAKPSRSGCSETLVVSVRGWNTLSLREKQTITTMSLTQPIGLPLDILIYSLTDLALKMVSTSRKERIQRLQKEITSFASIVGTFSDQSS